MITAAAVEIRKILAIAVFAALVICAACGAASAQRGRDSASAATATAVSQATKKAPVADTKPVSRKPAKAALAPLRNSTDVVPPDVKTREDFYRDEPNIPRRSSGVSIWRVLGSMILVSLLIVGALFVMKQFYARTMRLDLKGRHINVMDVVQLGAGRAVFLVRVGSRALLLGSADKGLAFLSDVTDSVELEAAEEPEAAAQGFGFRKQFNEAIGMLGKKQQPSQTQFNSKLKDRLNKLEDEEK